ncbi:MAG: N-acetylmuramoyl-L-alanine amidase [Clostridia bacterium]|nr:N-acetylmuramoyl-L-alanine amidase [Clostridia bacterium]
MKTILKAISLLLALITCLTLLAACAKKPPLESNGEPSLSSPFSSKEPSVQMPSTPSPSAPPILPSEASPSLSPVLPSPEPTPTPTPTPSEDPRDPDFDLKPNGVTSVTKKTEDLSKGSLVLVDEKNGYASLLTKDLKIIKTQGTGVLAVSEFMHQVTSETLSAFEKMILTLQKETLTTKSLLVRSAFRDEAYYKDLIEKNESNPDFKTDTPGFSEHHTGLALDVKFWDGTGSYTVGLDAVASESLWLKRNAHRFGIIERYTKDKSGVTGKDADADHFRYVGIAHASYMYQKNLCLEEYLEEIKKYTPNDRLVVTDGNGYSWSVYYVAASAEGNTTVILPQGVVYELSGNNKDGFIVAVKSVWEGPLTDEAPKIAVTGLTLEQSAVSLQKGERLTLNAAVTPANATNKGLTFASSNEQVVTVSPLGVLKGVAEGSAIITVKTAEGGFEKTVQVTVSLKDGAPTVWLDAGHGCDNSQGVADVGTGTGTPFFTLSGGLYEADLNMEITSRVSAILKKAGYTVLLTRDGYRKEHVTVSKRAEEANDAGADLFVSIHANSFTDGTAKGARVYHYAEHERVEECLALSRALCGAINGTGGCSATTVSPSTAEYAVLTHTDMPSILVETCFLTNQADAEKAITAEWCAGMANAIASAIMAQYPIAG